MLKIITESENHREESLSLTLDELAKEGARQMIELALQLEVEDYLSRLQKERDERGRALVVRNGRGRPRQVTVGSGTLEIQAPRVNDRRPDQKFTSAILPPYVRRSPNVFNVLPVLYLRGLSTGDFAPALKELLGEEASGLSAASIARFVKCFQEEHAAFGKRDLSTTDYVYIWADGVHFNIRLEEDRLAVLVVVGVTAEGRKELIAVEDGYRESSEAWSSVLRSLKRRGMNAPVLAVGDGALGFWNALAEVYPETQRQNCWVHKIANVLDKLPKRLQAQAKRKLHEIMNAPTKKVAEKEKKLFVEDYQAKYPKATASLERDWDYMLTMYDFPAEHWIHLRTTNPIESTFSTVKNRTRTTRGAGSRQAGLAMAFKLLQMAESGWRAIRSPQLTRLVFEGKKFVDGVLLPKKTNQKRVAA